MTWCDYISGQEDANWGACFEAAEKAGHPKENVEDCEDGSFGCPECPWRDK